MDRRGVGMHALSLTQPMVYWAYDELATQLCRAFNDSISAVQLAHPDRFIGFACLPFQNAQLALEELERAVTHKQLPSTSGFFFGNDSDDHYREHDLKFVRDAKAEIFTGLKVFYNSSW